MQNRCFCCLDSNHLASECTLKVSLHGVHLVCRLTFDKLSNVVFHSSTNCRTTAADRLVPCLMYLYNCNSDIVEKKSGREFSGIEEFFYWLFDMENGITHEMYPLE